MECAQCDGKGYTTIALEGPDEFGNYDHEGDECFACRGKGTVFTPSLKVRKRASYNVIPNALTHKLPFKGNSMWSELVEKDGRMIYWIFSYSTVIAKVDVETDELLFFDEDYYSETTSRHQDLVRRIFR